MSINLLSSYFIFYVWLFLLPSWSPADSCSWYLVFLSLYFQLSVALLTWNFISGKAFSPGTEMSFSYENPYLLLPRAYWDSVQIYDHYCQGGTKLNYLREILLDHQEGIEIKLQTTRATIICSKFSAMILPPYIYTSNFHSVVSEQQNHCDLGTC